MNHNQAKYKNIALVHSVVNTLSAQLNVPGLPFHICPDDGSFEPKHVAEFLILITIYIDVLLSGINYYIMVQLVRTNSNRSSCLEFQVIVSDILHYIGI